MRIGFSSGNSFVSRAIRWFTHSKASHTYIVFTAADEKLVINANVHGVVCEHYENYKKHTTIVAEYDIVMSEDEEHTALAYALKQLLLPYDFLALFGFGWVLFNKAFGRQVRQPFRNKAAYICSELVITTLQAPNFPASHLMDREFTSPEDIIDFLDSHNRAKLV